LGLLRAVPPTGVRVRDLPTRTSLSRRMVRPAVSRAEKSGWVVASPGEGRSGPTVALTAAGADAAARAQDLMDSADRQWIERVGPDDVGRVRAALESVVAQLQLELPHYPISYGSVDFRISGGWGIKSPGQDWKPVARGPGDTVSDLGLAALLSQAIVAIALAYEGAPAVLAIETGLVVGFGDSNTVAFDDLPRYLGVKGDGKSGLERHGWLTVSPSPDPASPPRKLAHLTELGRRQRDNHPALLDRLEREWQRAYGPEVVTALRQALEAADARFDPALPEHLLVMSIG